MFKIPSPRHNELQRKILEIGRLEGYFTDKEEKIPGFRIDAIWYTKKNNERISIAFEVELSNQIAKSLAALNTTWENNGARGVLVVPENKIARARAMLDESFRQLSGKVNVILDTEIDKLYASVMERRTIKEKIGYELFPC